MSTITPNMNLVIPTVGSTPGPDWASDLNSSLTLIDSHDHTPGKGTPISPSGISINADLSFGSNNATSLRSSRYTPQASPLALATDLGATYVSGADLYYNDTAGNQVRITQGGSVVGSPGSITGLPSGTASASYSTGVFTWQASTLTPATMDQGSTIIRENVASGKGVTLQTVTSLAANYTLILPSSLPASQKIMTLDNLGQLSAPYTVDGSTITIAANVIGVPNGGIGQAQLASAAVTNAKISAGAVDSTSLATNAVSTIKIQDAAVTPAKLSASITGSNTTTTINSTPSATVTVTLTGRPVLLMVTSGGATYSGAITLDYSRNGTPIANFYTSSGAGSQSVNYSFLDLSGATGSTTFGLTSSGTINAGTIRLAVVQLL